MSKDLKKSSAAAPRGVGGGRGLTVKLKTARGRKISSALWLQRQLNDPYVAQAQQSGYRSRAAFKLLEMDDKHHILKPGAHVVDLGAAPGGWTQVAVARTKALAGQGRVVSLDLQPMEPVPGAHFLLKDFTHDDAPALIIEALGGEKVDVVLSDMAAQASGHAATDHMRIMMLAEMAFDFARHVLKPGGVYLAKVLQGGTEKELLDGLKKHFKTVKHVKPPASRKDSSEMYVLALDFREVV